MVELVARTNSFWSVCACIFFSYRRRPGKQFREEIVGLHFPLGNLSKKGPIKNYLPSSGAFSLENFLEM